MMSMFPQFAQFDEADTRQAGGMLQFEPIANGRQENLIPPNSAYS